MILAFALGCLFGALVGVGALVEFDGWLVARHATFRDPTTRRFASYARRGNHH